MLICFDYDGVIVDSFDHLLNICKTSQKSTGCGRAPESRDFRTTRNLTFPRLGSDLGIPVSMIDDFCKHVFSELNSGTQDSLFEGMSDAFKALAENHTLCVVTANTEGNVSNTLDHAEISSCFSSISGGEKRLDKSEQITAVRQELGFSPDQTVMVGDMVSDITMAKKAGVRSMGVTWGYQDREMLATESPDYLVSTPDELLNCIQTMGND